MNNENLTAGEAVAQEPEPDIKKAQNGGWKEFLCGVAKDLIPTAIIVLLLFKVIFNITIVSGNSMVPTLHDGDILLLSHAFYEPDYGDIIVFQQPDEGVNYVKRVIGMPGDIIEISRTESVVYRNGEALEEDYISDKFFGPVEMDGPVTVEEGHYFVLGDNRFDSRDSRFNSVGQVSEDQIVGGYLFRVFQAKH